MWSSSVSASSLARCASGGSTLALLETDSVDRLALVASAA
jgi:hypothetical protein